MTLTKRDLVIRISEDLRAEQEKLEKEQKEQQKAAPNRPGRKKVERQRIGQQQVLDVVQKALDYIIVALANGDKVELRKFGVFEVRTRKARIGRNPNAPATDVPIPERSVVKFKAGKEMRAEVSKLPAQAAAKAPPPPAQT